jgi:type II secretory pathway pseudopilin PulG
VKSRDIISREGGFTIQEILVVIIVSSLLLSFGLTFFQFTSRVVGGWIRKSDSRITIQRATQQVLLDVQKGNSTALAQDSTLIIDKATGRRIRYRFHGAAILRNELALTGKDYPYSVTLNDSTDGVSILMIGQTNGSRIGVASPWSSRSSFEREKGERSESSR